MDNPTLTNNGEAPQTITFNRNVWACAVCHYSQDFADTICPNDGQPLSIVEGKATAEIVDPAVVPDLVAVVNQKGSDYDTRPLTPEEQTAKQAEVDTKLNELRADDNTTEVGTA